MFGRRVPNNAQPQSICPKALSPILEGSEKYNTLAVFVVDILEWIAKTYFNY